MLNFISGSDYLVHTYIIDPCLIAHAATERLLFLLSSNMRAMIVIRGSERESEGYMNFMLVLVIAQKKYLRIAL